MKTGALRKLAWVALILGVALSVVVILRSSPVRGRYFLWKMGSSWGEWHSVKGILDLGADARPYLLQGLASPNPNVRRLCLQCYPGYGESAQDCIDDKLKIAVGALFDEDERVSCSAYTVFMPWVFQRDTPPNDSARRAVALILKREYPHPNLPHFATATGFRVPLVTEWSSLEDSKAWHAPSKALLVLGRAYSEEQLASVWRDPSCSLALRRWAVECLVFWHCCPIAGNNAKVKELFSINLESSDVVTRQLALAALVLLGDDAEPGGKDRGDGGAGETQRGPGGPVAAQGLVPEQDDTKSGGKDRGDGGAGEAQRGPGGPDAPR